MKYLKPANGLTFSVQPGATIYAVVNEAIAIAKDLNCLVTFKFNDHIIVVEKHAVADEVIAKYMNSFEGP